MPGRPSTRARRDDTVVAPRDVMDRARDGDPDVVATTAPNRTPPTLPLKTVWTPAGRDALAGRDDAGVREVARGVCAGAWRRAATKRAADIGEGDGRRAAGAGGGNGRNSTYQGRAATAPPGPGGSECLDEAVTGARRRARPVALLPRRARPASRCICALCCSLLQHKVLDTVSAAGA